MLAYLPAAGLAAFALGIFFSRAPAERAAFADNAPIAIIAKNDATAARIARNQVIIGLHDEAGAGAKVTAP
jgi:hypothetical protein